MKYLIFIFYYIYAIFVVCLFSYIIFVLDKSAWWILVMLLLVLIKPTTNKEDV